MTYSLLLERLGPLPSCREVSEFLGVIPSEIYQLIQQGKLEAIETKRKKRVVLNSLFEYLKHQQRADVYIGQQLEVRKTIYAQHAVRQETAK
jgi:hypothetical protein